MKSGSLMSQETSPSQVAVQIPAEEQPKPVEQPQKSPQELVDSLKNLQEDIGQICELSSEEKTLVAEFFGSLLKILQPLATALPVSVAIFPKETGEVAHASMDPTGHLVILYRSGQMELKNLAEEKNRDLMIEVVEDILPKFKEIISTHRRKIENRMKFLSLVTKELQKVSKALSTAAIIG
jgi:hypothetical protein